MNYSLDYDVIKGYLIRIIWMLDLSKSGVLILGNLHFNVLDKMLGF